MARILIIDDDTNLRRVMRKVLERAGHTVYEAENGLRGIEVVERELPDLVVTDLLMPEKEGIETIVELRERFPSIGIIAVSGAGGVGDRGPLIDAELFGADAALPKPFSIDDFLGAIDSVLQGG